ncbi:hypothetical protein CS542_05380 [Pedobacter sp. IW39]|nr:hypothetical protein CS542_05380 [Pedobacter sp. IW39]
MFLQPECIRNSSGLLLSLAVINLLLSTCCSGIKSGYQRALSADRDYTDLYIGCRPNSITRPYITLFWAAELYCFTGFIKNRIYLMQLASQLSGVNAVKYS